MALIDDVTARTPPKDLVALTNPEDPNPTVVDAVLLQNLVDDMEGYFEDRVQVVFDSTNKKHVGPAVRGVILLLELNKGHSVEKQERFDTLLEQLERLAKTEGRDKIDWELESAAGATDNEKPWSRDAQFDEMNLDDPAKDKDPDEDLE